MLSQSSHNFLLAQFSQYVHIAGLKHHSFYFHFDTDNGALTMTAWKKITIFLTIYITNMSNVLHYYTAYILIIRVSF